MKKILNVILIFIIFKSIVFFAHIIYVNVVGLQLLHFEHLATEDIEFNDIYYFTKTQNKTKNNNDIVLINTGSIKNDSTFRISLAKLIDKVNSCNPKTIGLDILFNGPKNSKYDSLLESSIKNNNVVLATESKTSTTFSFNSNKKGIVDFPVKKGQTIRTFYNYKIISGDTIQSFSSLLSKKESKDSIETIKYITDENGFYDIYRDDKIELNNFPALEGADLLDDHLDYNFSKILKGKIIIIGHLGNDYMNNKYDIEDKFKVPVSNSLFNRDYVMPGTAIHANIVNMKINSDNYKTIDGWKYELISNLILFSFLLLFYYIHHTFALSKLINICIILFSTIPIIFIFCVYLMDLNIYYKVGSLFMQVTLIEEFIDVVDGFNKKFIRKKNHE